MEYKKISKGTVLLAEPFMQDPNFKRAAVLLCEHDDEEGSIGFVMNKPLDIKVNDLITDFQIGPKAVHRIGRPGVIENNMCDYV